MSPDTDLLGELFEELTRRTGLRAHEGHADRLRQVLRAHAGGESDGAWSPSWLDDPGLLDALVDTVAIDETYFFRHGDQLTFLRSTVLPQLLSERGDDHALQFWSAGCADGEEPYTLAVILAEEGLADRSDVLATDLTTAALDRAREATYRPWSLRSAEVTGRSELFLPADRGRFRLSPAVTEQVTFRQHNLLDPTYPSPLRGAAFDVVLCRNVLLHLTPAAVRDVVPRLVRALAPGGWLITAPADPVPLELPGVEELEPVPLPTGGLIYRRRGPQPGREEPAPVEGPAPPAVPRTKRRRRADRRRRALAPSPPRLRSAATGATPPATPPAMDGRTRCREARTLLAEGRAEAAVEAAMAAAFLEPDLAVAHLTLGLAASQAGQRAVAGRAFRRAAELLDRLPVDVEVELGDGETAGPLAELARAHALLSTEPAP